MEIKTEKDILITMINEAKVDIINREVAIETLKLMQQDKVITTRMDRESLQPIAVTVKNKLKELEEDRETDKVRFEVLNKRMKECE